MSAVCCCALKAICAAGAAVVGETLGDTLTLAAVEAVGETDGEEVGDADGELRRRHTGRGA